MRGSREISLVPSLHRASTGITIGTGSAYRIWWSSGACDMSIILHTLNKFVL